MKLTRVLMIATLLLLVIVLLIGCKNFVSAKKGFTTNNADRSDAVAVDACYQYILNVKNEDLAKVIDGKTYMYTLGDFDNKEVKYQHVKSFLYIKNINDFAGLKNFTPEDIKRKVIIVDLADIDNKLEVLNNSFDIAPPLFSEDIKVVMFKNGERSFVMLVCLENKDWKVIDPFDYLTFNFSVASLNTESSGIMMIPNFVINFYDYGIKYTVDKTGNYVIDKNTGKKFKVKYDMMDVNNSEDTTEL